MILLGIGLLGLWLGTRWIISGALGVAGLFNLPHTFVGLAILSVGTDLPEVFVSVEASLLQLNGIESSGIITGNAIGSSISQITVVLGIAGLFMVFTMPRPALFRNGFFLLASIFLLYTLGYDGTINRLEAGLLIGLYGLYYYVLLRSDLDPDGEPTDASPTKLRIAFYLVAGLGVLMYSAHLVVDNALLLVEEWGVKQSFVGIAIIGLGTSLPELAVSVGAAFRKSAGLSIGNIIGSNVFDGLIPVGLGGLISPVHVSQPLLAFDLPILFAVTGLVLIFLATKRGISRLEGIVLIAIYVAYLSLKISQ